VPGRDSDDEHLQENPVDKSSMLLIMTDGATSRPSAAPLTSPARQVLSISSGCLFCGHPWGEVRRSDEHVLPQWMRKYESDLLKASHNAYSAGFDLDDQAREFVELPTVLTTKKSSLLTLKTREVCTSCNNGWMSRLEEAARPLIRRVAEAARTGEATTLTVDEARTLGVWCQKTATTYELTSDRPRVATTAMGQQLAASTPLRGGLVWLARHPRDYDLSIGLVHIDVSSTPVPRPGAPDSQIALLSIVYHWVTFMTFITDRPGRQPLPLPLDRWSLLWPVRRQVEYPPLAVLTGNELNRTMVEHGHWLPLVQATSIRRSPIPLQVRHRN
jgi:hypothetical protein